MKFNCGKETYDNYKITKAEKLEAKRLADHELYMKMKLEGEIIFAWFPITLHDGTCVWLEKVRRTCISSEFDFKFRRITDHREIWKYTTLK